MSACRSTPEYFKLSNERTIIISKCVCVCVRANGKGIKFTSSRASGMNDEVIIFYECEAGGKYYCLNPEGGARGFKHI